VREPAARFFIFITLIVPTLLNCNPQPTSEKKPVIRPVVTYNVPDFTAGRTRRFTGTAKAALKTNLSFRVGGKVNVVNVSMGDHVQAGDEIARLDASDFRISVQQLEAELARIDAVLVEAKASYDRVRPLYEKKIVSRMDMDNAKAKYESTLAQKKSGLKALKLSRKRLEYTRLNAPLDGDISEVHIEAHQVIQAGQVVAVMTTRGPVEMEIGVPARLISRIKKGAQATVKFDALPDNKFQAQVKEVGIVATENSIYPVTLIILEAKKKVKPGMVGEARFMLKATTGDYRVLVPAEAVVGAPGKTHFVWIVAPETKIVSKQPVQVGNLTSEGLQIKEGLKPGAVIVTRGVNRMEEGMQVRLLE
jgi:RND family efflux transporter MFP subunit